MEEKLRNIIEMNGGLFKIDDLEHPSIILFFNSIQDKILFNQNLLKDFYTNTSPSLNVFFTNSKKDDAEANTYLDDNGNKVDYILISAILPLALLNIFLRMLSQPNIFENVGNHTKEVLNEKDLTTIEEILDNPKNITVFPKCKIREFYALELAKSALDFIYCHEFAHLYRGHCDYLINNKQKLKLTDSKDVNEKDLSKVLIYQTIEFEADLIGMNISWFLMNTLVKNFPLYKLRFSNSDQGSALSATFENSTYAFRTLSISAYTFYRIYAKDWNPETRFFDSSGQITHPDAVIRMMYIFEVFFRSKNSIVEHEDVVVQWNQSSPFFKNFINFIHEAEKGFASIQGDAINTSPLHSAFILNFDESKKYLELLFENRAKLTSDLEPYLRGKYFN